MFLRLAPVSYCLHRGLHFFPDASLSIVTGRYSTVHRAVNKRIRDMTRVTESDAEAPLAPSSSSFLTVGKHISGFDEASGSYHDSREAREESAPGKCALKLISKEQFWQQVQTNLERKDTLVREVLAQSFLVNSIISCGPADGYDELSVHGMELPIVQINGVFETRCACAFLVFG